MVAVCKTLVPRSNIFELLDICARSPIELKIKLVDELFSKCDRSTVRSLRPSELLHLTKIMKIKKIGSLYILDKRGSELAADICSAWAERLNVLELDRISTADLLSICELMSCVPDGLHFLSPFIKPILDNRLAHLNLSVGLDELIHLLCVDQRMGGAHSRHLSLKCAEKLTISKSKTESGSSFNITGLVKAGDILIGELIMPWASGGGRESWGIWKMIYDLNKPKMSKESLKILDEMQEKLELIYTQEKAERKKVSN